MAAFLPGALQAGSVPVGVDLNLQSLNELEERLRQIDTELQELSRYSLRKGVGPVGWRGAMHVTPEQTEWFHIELQKATPIDRIALVPAIIQDVRGGLRADGFPEKFRVLAGNGRADKGRELAAFSKEDGVLPRMAPLVISCATTASWIRVEASMLTKLFFNEHYNMVLSEIMVFHGEKNVALHQTVTGSSEPGSRNNARKECFLVDGFTPFQMHAGRGSPSPAFLGISKTKQPHILTIDLEGRHRIDRINLHTIVTGDTFPQSHPAGMGIPRRLIVEGANRADFTDALELVDNRFDTSFDYGSVITRSFPETACRYIRITAVEPYPDEIHGINQFATGFAEIEVFSSQGNVALHKTVTGNIQPHARRTYQALTDGRNVYGMILPLRQWIEELALRHELERERPRIETEMVHRYEKQKAALHRLSWLAALLAAGVVFTWLIDRMLRMHQVTRIRERFAADLHDEIGANLHTIGLLGDLIGKKADTLPSGVSLLIERIRGAANRSIVAVQHVSDLQGPAGLYAGLVADMRRAAERVVIELNHDLSVEGERFLSQLDPRDQRDLFLFYQECLINSCRHSGATELTTRLIVKPKKIQLTFIDNGIGLSATDGKELPASLRRRAKFLRAKVTCSQPREGGSCMSLTMRNGKRWLRLK